MAEGMRQENIRAKLARRGDTSTPAAQRRYAAAIMAAGMNKTAFAAAIGVAGVQAITNSTTGKNYPSRDGMIYLYESAGIDIAFIMVGDFGKMVPDVQDRVFAALQVLESGGELR